MAQSVVIDLCSDWLDGPVHWDLIYTVLIGQMVHSVVIDLLCSDWCYWPSLLGFGPPLTNMKIKHHNQI